MKALCIRTDNPTAELYVYDDDVQLGVVTWEGHRQLGETIHSQMRTILDRAGLSVHDLERVVVYKGPGSFTGLRIGISVANALAYGLGVSVVGTTGGSWITDGLHAADPEQPYVTPEYGAEPHITVQKK